MKDNFIYQYYKEGKQSLKWDFRSGSKLNIALEQPLTLMSEWKFIRITLWIYNEVLNKIPFVLNSFPQGDIPIGSVSSWYRLVGALAGSASST